MEESVENDSIPEDSNQEGYDNVEAKVMEYCSSPTGVIVSTVVHILVITFPQLEFIINLSHLGMSHIECGTSVSSNIAVAILKLNISWLETNQPTKKGGDLRKRQTSSLPRFDHFCVRNAGLEMVNRALKL
jgi:hypothetical protein